MLPTIWTFTAFDKIFFLTVNDNFALVLSTRERETGSVKAALNIAAHQIYKATRLLVQHEGENLTVLKNLCKLNLLGMMKWQQWTLWLCGMFLLCDCVGTVAVSIMSHLDLQASQTSISVELAVIPVGLTIAATHWPLVGLTALRGDRGEGDNEKIILKSFVSYSVIHIAQFSPTICGYFLLHITWFCQNLVSKVCWHLTTQKTAHCGTGTDKQQSVLQSHNPHLYTETAGLPLFTDSTLSAGSTEHIGTHFALALQFLKNKKTYF